MSSISLSLSLISNFFIAAVREEYHQIEDASRYNKKKEKQQQKKPELSLDNLLKRKGAMDKVNSNGQLYPPPFHHH